MVNDPLGDLLIRLKNASMVGKPVVVVPYSAFKNAVADKLEQSGFVRAVGRHGKKARKVLEVELLYSKDGTPRIEDVSLVSKPGRRIYRSTKSIRSERGGRGLLILSTPKGILTDEEARKSHVGGEALFKIW